MKRIIWTGALALTAMACLTACGDDDSNGTSGGYDSGIESIKTSVCDIKKSDDKWVVNTHPVQETYIWTDDGVVVQYRTNVSSKEGCEYELERRKEIESDMVYTCEEHILLGTDSTTLKGLEKDAVIISVKPKCEMTKEKFKESLDDEDDESGDDEDEDGDDEDEGGEESGDDGDEGGEAASASCNFEKSDDTWVIANGEGGGEMTIKWKDGKAVTVTKSEQADEELCELTLEIFSSDPTGTGTYSCDGKYLVIEDPDTYGNLSRNDLYKMYCGS